MKNNPTVEKVITRESGRKVKILYSIMCNDQAVYEMDYEQLSLIHAMIGEFMEERKGEKAV